MYRLAIVVPCYKEEEVLEICSEALRGVLDDLISKGKIKDDSFILFVNDGSTDRTWELIDGERNILDIGTIIKGNFGEKAEPVYERLAQYFKILCSYGFIVLKTQ